MARVVTMVRAHIAPEREAEVIGPYRESVHAGLPPFIEKTFLLRDWQGLMMVATDDQKIGSVAHMHGMGPTSQIIVDVGGFLGIGSKRVAVMASNLDFMRDENGDVHAVTTWTKDELKAMPEHTEPM